VIKEPIFVTRPLLPDIEKINSRMREIWNSKWITNNGNMHRELEKQLRSYLQVDNLSLFNNGTSALLLGIKALGLKGEVITTPFTFPATLQALDWNGLTPVFCDIDPQSLNIDADKIESLITEETCAILGVHVFGNPCEVEKIQLIAERYNLKVIYDGAHVFGTKIGDEAIGRFGDMTMFSFHATKLFNTVEGGGLAFRGDHLKERLDLLKNFGIAGPEEVLLSGLNAKMNEIQAAVGLEVLKIVEEERTRRIQIKEVYESNLKGINGIRIVTDLEEEKNSLQYFVIAINEENYGKSRDWVHEELKKYNIYTRKYFYPLCSDFDWYKHLESAQACKLPQAHKAVNQVLAMPFYGELEPEIVKNICQLLVEFQNPVGLVI